MAGLELVQSLSQRMALSPQMRQSLAILQAPAMELGMLMRREAEANPVLEISPPQLEVSLDGEREKWERGERGEGGEAEGGEADGDFAVLGKLDDPDYLYSAGGNNEYDGDAEAKRNFFLDSIPAAESLQQHLATQLDACDLKPGDRAVAEEIVGSLDEDGYLRTALADIAQARLTPLADAERMLALVQTFDPAGVGARDLRECLALQVKAEPPPAAVRGDVTALLGSAKAFAAIAEPGGRIAAVAKALGIGEKDAERAVRYLSRLDPRPGRRYSQVRTEYVNPEIVVRRVEGRWTAFLDESGVPGVSLSPEWMEKWESLKGQTGGGGPKRGGGGAAEEKRWLDEKVRAARAFLQSVAQRGATLLAVAQTVVDRQNGYFERGAAFLNPLSMADVAAATGFNESTVSRAVAGKWLRSPQGLTPLRSFFTAAVKSAGGEATVSNEAAREMLREIVAAENPQNPLSDSAIAKALERRGVKIARRTVAKYREKMRIPGASERRVAKLDRDMV